MQVLSQETARKVLMFIIEQKNPTHTDIVYNLGISAASVNWHVSPLISFKIIDSTTNGKYTIYHYLIMLILNT